MTSTRSKTQVSDTEITNLVSMFNSGQFGELEIRARLLLSEHSDSGVVWKVLGVSLQMQGKDAVDAFKMAARFLPSDAEVYFNLGVSLNDRGQLKDAVTSYRSALIINPGYVEAHNNLGNVLRDLRCFDEAVDSFGRALKLRSNYAEAHSNLGITLHDIGRLHDAVVSCNHALKIKPDYAKAHYNLGIALFGLGKLEEAAASYRRAIQYKVDYAEAHCNLGNVLRDGGKFDAAMASYRTALSIKTDFVEAQNNLLLVCNHLPEFPVAMLLAEAGRFGDMVARQVCPYQEWVNSPEPERRLRIGLVSGDLRNHPVGYFIEGVLAALASDARKRLQFMVYSTNTLEDVLTDRIKISCHGWYSVVELSDENIAKRINEDNIDILIDLSGHTAHNRLSMFAWKPAPIQATWLGYFATTGVAAIDYLIADPWTVPESAGGQFTEEVWRLPETRLCFTPPDVEVPVSSLPAKTNDFITFGCFNNLSKMNDAVVALWARVLHAVPGSRLFLKARQLHSDAARQRTVERFAVHGLDASRLILEGPSPRAEYLAAYHRVDIALDPFPYTGGTTSAEALWMGVPVLTLSGERFLARQGLGLLMNAGLPDWVAADADDYVARAVTHAGDLQRLSALRTKLRQQVLASPLFDAQRFAVHFEAALRGMWRRWCSQQQSEKPSQ